MTFVVRSYRGSRLLSRIGVGDAQEARRWAARLLEDPQGLPDRVTVWRTLQDRSVAAAVITVSADDDINPFDGIAIVRE